MARHGKYNYIIELVRAGKKVAIAVPDKEILKLRRKQYPELKDCFFIPKIRGIEIKTVFIDEVTSQDNCYLDYNEDGYLTCTYNHKEGEKCLMSNLTRD